MSSLTASLDAVTQYLIAKLQSQCNSPTNTLKSTDGLVVLQAQDVYYGDQHKYPRVPSVAVEPSNRPRDLRGVTYRTDNNFTIYFLCYLAKVGQSNQETRQQIQQLSERIEDLIHSDAQLGGLVVHGWCSNNESGYTYRDNTLYRTNRITYNALSRTALR